MVRAGEKLAGLISVLLCVGLILSLNEAQAAGYTLRLENDSNSRLGVKNAIVHDDSTTILFWTWPDVVDPNARKDCAMNYYTVTLRPGLADVKPRLMAENACAGRAILFGGVLEDGNGKFIIRNRLEQWRDDEQQSSESFASLDHTKKLRVDSREIGSQFAEFSPTGDMVMAIMVNGYSASDWPGTSWVITSLKPNNDKRWLLKYDEAFSIESLWAGQDGSALLYISGIDMTRMVPAPEPKLLMITRSGQNSTHKLMEVPEDIDIDIESIRPGSMEDLQKLFQKQDGNPPEKFRELSARPRQDGGFDVLYNRESPDESRNGYFLLRLAADGSVNSEISLKSTIKDHGLDRWFDFYVDDGQLVLLSNSLVTQAGVNSSRKTWPQTIVSRVDLDSLQTISRLIPLDRQYLEAAMNAGDEGQQYLEGKPGGKPLLLTTLAGTPLSVSRGWLKKRGTLRFNEVTDDLVVFSEAYDTNQANLAREQRSRQKKANRQARQQQLSQEMKDSTGLSAEGFESLSAQEQAMHMMKDGNMEAMMAAMMKQAQSGMTPEQAAQMQASMAQVQAMTQGGSMALPSSSPSASTASQAAESSDASFTVDSLMRGHIQYQDSQGKSVTLSLINRQSEKELMSREFANGEIDEYVNLGRYKLPIEHIGALIKNADGKMLEDLKPQAR